MHAFTLLIVVHDTLLLTHLEAQGLIVQDFVLGSGHCFNVQTAAVCSIMYNMVDKGVLPARS